MRKTVVKLGFLAVSATAAVKMAVFPIVPGFDDTGPKADLQAQLDKDSGWKGYTLLIDPRGSLLVRPLPKKK